MKILDSGKIIDILTEKRDIVKNFGVRRVGIFGSYIRGEQRDVSDVDLLVEFSEGKKTYRNFYEFTEFMQGLLGKKVDVITPESLSPYIAPYIRKEIKYVQISS